MTEQLRFGRRAFKNYFMNFLSFTLIFLFFFGMENREFDIWRRAKQFLIIAQSTCFSFSEWRKKCLKHVKPLSAVTFHFRGAKRVENLQLKILISFSIFSFPENFKPHMFTAIVQKFNYLVPRKASNNLAEKVSTNYFKTAKKNSYWKIFPW